MPLITTVIQHLHGNIYTIPNTPFLLYTRHLTQNERQISLELQLRPAHRSPADPSSSRRASERRSCRWMLPSQPPPAGRFSTPILHVHGAGYSLSGPGTRNKRWKGHPSGVSALGRNCRWVRVALPGLMAADGGSVRCARWHCRNPDRIASGDRARARAGRGRGVLPQFESFGRLTSSCTVMSRFCSLAACLTKLTKAPTRCIASWFAGVPCQLLSHPRHGHWDGRRILFPSTFQPTSLPQALHTNLMALTEVVLLSWTGRRPS